MAASFPRCLPSALRPQLSLTYPDSGSGDRAADASASPSKGAAHHHSPHHGLQPSQSCYTEANTETDSRTGEPYRVLAQLRKGDTCGEALILVRGLRCSLCALPLFQPRREDPQDRGSRVMNAHGSALILSLALMHQCCRARARPARPAAVATSSPTQTRWSAARGP